MKGKMETKVGHHQRDCGEGALGGGSPLAMLNHYIFELLFNLLVL